MAKEELESLQNFATILDLIVHYYYQNDKRKKSLYFLTDLKLTQISPNLNYNELNAFMLGYKAKSICRTQ